MDQAAITELLRMTLDPARRLEAEKKLKEVEKIIGFCPTLLQVVMNDGVEAPVRQAGAIYFKNQVATHWVDKEVRDPREAASQEFSVHEQDRALIRDNIVEANVKANDVLRRQLSVCISLIAKQDFPGRWPQIVDSVSVYLQNPEPAAWPGALAAMYQLVKNYEYKKREERAPLYDAMNLLLPQTYAVMKKCEGNPQAPVAEIRKLILKVFFALTQYTLPLELINQEFFTQWMEVCNTAILAEIPQGVMDNVELDERPELIWWKEKKWALHIVSRIFERYGSPGNVLPEYKKWSEWYLKTFSKGILETVMKVLSHYTMEGSYISPRVLQLCLNYANTSVSHALSWKLLKPHVPMLVKDVIFKLMSYTQQDAELWESDPYEYVRIKFDIFEDFVSPVTAAQTLLHSICKKRKDALPQTMDMLLQVLQNPATMAAQKDGALHMIGTLADVLLKKKAYKEKMEEFLVKLVFPEFRSQFGHLRARACWMLHYFAEVRYRNTNVLIEAFNLTIAALLEDREVPVQVEAAIALQMMLGSHEEVARGVVQPKIEAITMRLLEVIRSTENDDLTTVMQKIICTYTEQLAPKAKEIAEHIVISFIQVLESGDGGDEKAITAMGLLNTLETLVAVLDNDEDEEESSSKAVKKVNQAHALLEPVILQAINHVFANSVAEFYEEILTLACDLTSNTISPAMWGVLEGVYQVFNTDGADYFMDMMPLLHNYVTVDTATFLSNPAYSNAMLTMCKTMFESGPGEDPECHAAKLLEVVILQCRGKNINDFVTQAVHLVLQRLQGEIKTSELRTMCIQVAIAALYYDPAHFFATINNNPAVIGQFIEQWLNDTDCFVGIHDRKLCILGLCQLLTMPNVPGVPENAKRMIPSLIMLFEGLKRAYENAQETDDDDSDEEGDGDDDDDDGEILNSDEDDIDEESAMYLENLQKKVTSTASPFGVTTSFTEDDDDDDEDDEFYEESNLEGYTTPLDENDAVDEYHVFKTTLEGLQASNPEWYAAVVGSLQQDQTKRIQDIFTLHQQRVAAKESKNIEKAGGYNFTQNTQVPSTFSFTSPQNGGGAPGQPSFTFGGGGAGPGN